MYEHVLSELRTERNLERFLLDNVCVLKKRPQWADPEEKLQMYVPTWHALGHNYVRMAPRMRLL